MPRYKLVIEYDGSAFSGWQRQENAPSVQQTLEEAAFHFCGQKVVFHAAGRTDAGVHALGQVATVDLEGPYALERIQGALNYHARPAPVTVLSVDEVPETFHARFSATARHYTYRILNRKAPSPLVQGKAWHVPYSLDLEAMQQGARHLEGHHDFTSFRAKECQAQSPLRTLTHFTWHQEGEFLCAQVQAPSFLHHQVRNMVGTLVEVGRHKKSPAWVAQVLAAKDRAQAGPTAPAHGLYFVRVVYGAQNV